MPLTKEQSTKFRSWLNDRKWDTYCPVCGQRDWKFGEIISARILSTKQNQSIPMCQLFCARCQYIMLFAAEPIGLV
jgi:predicted nucleic-acid-binding Zn-ribbon protein